MSTKHKAPKRIRVMLTANEIHAYSKHLEMEGHKYKLCFRWHLRSKLATAANKLGQPDTKQIFQ